MFLEFNGLPGCGKTTTSLRLVEAIGKKGIPVVFLDEYLATRNRNGRDALSYFMKGLLSLKVSQVFDLARFSFSLPRKSPQKPLMLMTLVMQYAFYLSCVKDNPDAIVVSDQCFVQQIISCYFDQKIERGQGAILKVLGFLKDDYRVVNALAPVDAASKRISGRKDGDGRLDYLDSGTVAGILEIQQRNFAVLREIIKRAGIRSFDIDMLEDPAGNAGKIMDAFDMAGRMGK